MSRLFGLCGGAVRQDVPVETDADASSDGDRGDEAWVAYRKAKKQGDTKRKEERAPRKKKLR